jgi:PAS domain S-box-containing protein
MQSCEGAAAHPAGGWGAIDPTSEETLRLMVGSVIDYAIFMLDVGGRVVTWNEGARRLKQYESSEILGQHFSTFYPAEDREAGKPQRLLQEAMRSGRVDDKGWRVRKDGTRFWADVVITAMRGPDGDLRGFCKVTRDLSEQRTADDALRQSEERLRLMVESVVDYAIFMLDASGRVTTWNEGAHRLKQYPSAEIVGRHFSIFYPPEDREAGKPERLLAAAVRDGRVEDEGWRVRQDGSRFWADVVITALRNGRGELRGFAKVTRDLTERKAAEDALRLALDRKHEAMAQLRETDRRRHDLIAMVAHDLRSPVGVLHGTTDMLVEDWERLDDVARLRLLQSMLATTDRLRGLVDDVLDVARIDAGTLSFATTEVELMPVVRRAAVDVDRAGSRVRVSCADELLRVRGDERRIWQILTNLLSNALKFSPAEEPVEVSVTADGDDARIAVVDRGIGISAADQPRLFQAFARFGANAARQPGTGLGLYIAHALATAQGGTITVESAPGAGSTFALSLPLATE